MIDIFTDGKLEELLKRMKCLRQIIANHPASQSDDISRDRHQKTSESIHSAKYSNTYSIGNHIQIILIT